MKSHFRSETIRTSMRLGGWILFCLLFPIALALSAPGQKQKGMLLQPPYKVGLWKPWNEPLPPRTAHYDEGTGKIPPFTGVEARVVLEKLARITDVFRKLPVLNPPMGFEVYPVRLFSFVSPDVPSPVPGTLQLNLVDYLTNRDTCKTWLEPEGFPAIRIEVNSIEAIYAFSRPYRKDERGPMYRVPKVVGYVAGFPEYYTERIVLTKIKRPLWVPVSQERFLRCGIRDFQANLKMAEEAQAKGSAYQQWLADTAKRRREEEEAYRELRKTDPKAAETMRAQLEKVGKEAGEKLRASEAGDAAVVSKGMNSLREHIRAMEGELASMSPAARSSPAYYMIGGTSPRLSGLADPDAEGAELIVESNRDFFHRRKPVTSFQLIAVYGFLGREEALKDCEERMRISHIPRPVQGATTPYDSCFMDEKVVEVLRSLDWKALAAFLDEDTAEPAAQGTGYEEQETLRRQES